MAVDEMVIVTTALIIAIMARAITSLKIIRVRCLRDVDVRFAYYIPANTDEKIIDYDPNDPNLVDEPYLDVDNPYEGLGPGRPDSVSRALLQTAGRHSPDSIGHGKSLISVAFNVSAFGHRDVCQTYDFSSLLFVLVFDYQYPAAHIILQHLRATVKITAR